MKAYDTPPPAAGIPLRRVFITAMLAWTLVAGVVYTLEIFDNRALVTANSIAVARASFEKDIAFRRWAAKHGGVYVPATIDTPPNPYLKSPERDIATPSGRQLTLMNPAYMIRQVYEIIHSAPDSPQGHITSLKPIRPENAPDAWERKALEIFEKGGTEFSEYQEIGGIPYFRFMHVLKTERPCLKCHAADGYREGDVRGGISVTIPVAGLERSMRSSNMNHLAIFSIVWALGIGGILLSSRVIGSAARALSESEERHRQQFQQSRAVMLIIDPESGAIVDANPAACSFYGYSGKIMLAMNISDINTSSTAELTECIAGVRDGSKRQFMARHRNADGTVMDVEVFSNPLLFQGKTLLHSIVVDISDRVAAERELRNKMDFAESLILNSTTPTFVINFDHQVLIWNRALEELTGILATEVIGTDEQWRAFYPAQRPCLADIVLDGSHHEAQQLYAHVTSSRLIPDGLSAEGDYSFHSRRCNLVFSAAPIRDRDGKIIAAIETLEDITERISLESLLLQSQKMDSIGILAGGIAHDFNNVLSVINGYADLLELSLKDDEENMFFAREISASVSRAADMTRTLLAFSGKQELLLQYDDLGQILACISKSLGRLIREDIELITLPGEQRLPAYVDRVQIEQVLINLVVNARDAMGTGGTITVSTMAVKCEEARVEGNAVIPPGNYACLSVKDNGDGIDAKTLEQIFEPFFTTKSRGKGTGLGLAIVQNIVNKHNGHISVTTIPGKGTEFRVYLQLHSGEVHWRHAPVMQEINYHGTETVLLVEDDDDIVKMLRDVLSRYGYTILTAADGIEGMAMFYRHRDIIQIAIIDVIMPRMNGVEVVERFRAERPELPIIMTSGYSDDMIDPSAINGLKVTFLHKPVKSLELLATIRASLSGSE